MCLLFLMMMSAAEFIMCWCGICPFTDEDESPIPLKATLARGSTTHRSSSKVPPIAPSSERAASLQDDDTDSAYSISTGSTHSRVSTGSFWAGYVVQGQRHDTDDAFFISASSSAPSKIRLSGQAMSIVVVWHRRCSRHLHQLQRAQQATGSSQAKPVVVARHSVHFTSHSSTTDPARLVLTLCMVRLCLWW